LKIRLAKAHDLSTVTETTRRAYEHYIPIIGGVPMPMSEDYAPRIASGQVWLLEEGGPAGLIVLEERDDALLIFSIAIAPERQRAGLGRKLLAFAEDVARDRGLGNLTLFTNAKMERNIRIYSRFGYRETRRRAHPTRSDTVIVDMKKTLAAENRRSA
jgi:ribosomal protein S18 acetylase RimI-like enzyme